MGRMRGSKLGPPDGSFSSSWRNECPWFWCQKLEAVRIDGFFCGRPVFPGAADPEHLIAGSDKLLGQGKTQTAAGSGDHNGSVHDVLDKNGNERLFIWL